MQNTFLIRCFLFWIGWAWLSLLLTWSGFFYGWIFILYVVIWILSVIWLGIRNQKQSWSWRNIQWKKHAVQYLFLVVGGSFFASLIIAAQFDEGTLFTGRDQGSIAMAAIELADNRRLTFSTQASQKLFSIYGEGQALHYPGFAYTAQGELTTEFPLAVTSWYASFISVMPASGGDGIARALQAANFTLLFLFFTSFFLSIRTFVSGSLLLPFFLVLATSFTVFYFPRLTLSENFFGAFFWVLVYFLYHLFGKKDFEMYTVVYVLLLLVLLPFVRIEGYVVSVIALLVVLMQKNMHASIAKYRGKLGILTALLIGALFWNAVITLPFLKNIAKALIQSSLAENLSDVNTSSPTIITEKMKQLLQLLNLYAMEAVVFFGIIAFMIISYSYFAKNFPKKTFFTNLPTSPLLPFVISFPIFAYLLYPFISQDHPWMLRRFAFVIIPVLFWFSYIALSQLQIYLARKQWSKQHWFISKSVRWLLPQGILFVFFVIQLPVALHFFSMKSNENLLTQTQAIAEKVGSNDAVCVDQLATGDKWMMLAGPLLSLDEKDAFYCVNPNDIEKFDQTKFDRILFLIPEENLAWYETFPVWNKSQQIDSFTFSYHQLKPISPKFSLGITQLPEQIPVSQKLLLFEIIW